jgi:hypothetical protein
MKSLATEEQAEQKTIPTSGQMEVNTIARECAASFGRALEWYRNHFKLTTEQAIARLHENAEEYAQQILRRPANDIDWRDLDHIGNLDPQKALELWQAIKTQALEELRSGHRSAQALHPVVNHPWLKAQFLALRYELAEEWQPRNGIERQLIDTMALAQSGYFEWLEVLALRTSKDCVSQKKLAEEPWTPPRLTEAEAIEQAAAMMDKLNRIFLRSLRALRDLRRYSRPIVVQNAGQVNVGGQHLNVASRGLSNDGGANGEIR